MLLVFSAALQGVVIGGLIGAAGSLTGAWIAYLAPKRAEERQAREALRRASRLVANECQLNAVTMPCRLQNLSLLLRSQARVDRQGDVRIGVPEQAAHVNALLARHPNLDGIFASDTAYGQGAATAVQNAGKAGKIKIVAFDAEPDEVTALDRGLIQALIVQKAYSMGQFAVK